MTSLTQRLVRALTTRADASASTTGYKAQVTPPARTSLTGSPVGLSQAVAVPAALRALQILATAASQLPLDVERSGQVLTGAQVPAIIRRPNIDTSRSDFIEQLVLALAGHGNAYIYREGGQDNADTFNLVPLPPNEVTPWRDTNNRTHYSYDGHDYGPDRIRHLRFLSLPGHLLGVGPIGAAQATMTSANAMRTYSGQWWDTGHPSGILSTTQPLTADDARRYRNAWNLLDDDGNPLPPSANPSRVRVLGKDLSYSPVLISPKDSLWLEAQAYDTLEVARVFGVPASLMLTTPDGGSMTYANVEQEWIGFVRFTLMTYLRKIEDALTDLTARGQTVRFNVEALLRTDTASRYAAHATAITNGFMTVNEVRSIEHLPPLPDDATTPTTTPASQETPA
jgi:HK97 family phage portal protein